QTGAIRPESTYRYDAPPPRCPKLVACRRETPATPRMPVGRRAVHPDNRKRAAVRLRRLRRECPDCPTTRWTADVGAVRPTLFRVWPRRYRAQASRRPDPLPSVRTAHWSRRRLPEYGPQDPLQV